MDETLEKNPSEYFRVHKKVMYPILLLPIFILATILFFRDKFYDNIYINEISYKNILETSIFGLDKIAHAHELYLPIMNIALAVMTVFILYLIIVDEKNKMDRFTSVISIIIYIISPIFIFTFSTINRFALIIPLALLLFYVYRRKKYILSIITFILLCMLDMISSSIILISIFLFNYKDTTNKIFTTKKDIKDDEERPQKIIMPFMIMIAILLIGWVYAIMSMSGFFFFGMDQNYYNIIGMDMVEGHSYSHLDRYFLELGNDDFGVSFIGIILLMIGIHSSWKYKKFYTPLYITLSLFLALSILYNIQYLLICGVLISIFNAKGIEKIKKITWHFGELKKLSYIIIAIGLIISGITFSINHINSSPEKSLEKSTSVISSYFSSSNITCNILADKDNKYFIKYRSGTDVITEDDVEIAMIIDKRNENDIINALNEKNICIILSDDKLREEMIDDDNFIGLEFIMDNGRAFEKIYREENSNTDVWRFRYSKAFSDEIPHPSPRINRR